MACSFCGQDKGALIYNSKIADAHICLDCLTLSCEVILRPVKSDVIAACVKEKAKCSFCGKKPLIHGPACLVHICSGCVKKGAKAMLKHLEQVKDNPKED